MTGLQRCFLFSAVLGKSYKVKTYHKIIDFFRQEIWSIRTDDISLINSIWLIPVRVFTLACRGFDQDQCNLRASALTFYTLLSIVPLAAMAFGVAKGFGFEQLLENNLYDRFSRSRRNS